MIDVPTLHLYKGDEARPFWPAVRRDLDAILARWPDDWMPDDVWAEIKVGQAFLWVAGEPDEIEAWVIFQFAVTSYSRSLHIWNAAEKTTSQAADYWPQIMQIAADNGCNRITIETPRRWDRILPGAQRRFIYTFEVAETARG